jgi:hypothetical protein
MGARLCGPVPRVAAGGRARWTPRCHRGRAVRRAPRPEELRGHRVAARHALRQTWLRPSSTSSTAGPAGRGHARESPRRSSQVHVDIARRQRGHACSAMMLPLLHHGLVDRSGSVHGAGLTATRSGGTLKGRPTSPETAERPPGEREETRLASRWARAWHRSPSGSRSEEWWAAGALLLAQIFLASHGSYSPRRSRRADRGGWLKVPRSWPRCPACCARRRSTAAGSTARDMALCGGGATRAYTPPPPPRSPPPPPPPPPPRACRRRGGRGAGTRARLLRGRRGYAALYASFLRTSATPRHRAPGSPR